MPLPQIHTSLSLGNILQILIMLGGITVWYFGNSSAVEGKIYHVEYEVGLLKQRVAQSDEAMKVDREVASQRFIATNVGLDRISQQLADLRTLVAERTGKRQ